MLSTTLIQYSLYDNPFKILRMLHKPCQVLTSHLNVVKATVTGYEGCDLLSVLDELNTYTLTDSRVRLLSLYTSEIHKDILVLIGGFSNSEQTSKHYQEIVLSQRLIIYKQCC